MDIYAVEDFKNAGRDCEHFDSNNRCKHPDYHKDFALANICRIENCPELEITVF